MPLPSASGRQVTKPVFAFLLLFLWVFALFAQPHTPVPLWPDVAPGARGTDDDDIPKITIYLPNGRNTGTGVLVFPGGWTRQRCSRRHNRHSERRLPKAS